MVSPTSGNLHLHLSSIIGGHKGNSLYWRPSIFLSHKQETIHLGVEIYFRYSKSVSLLVKLFFHNKNVLHTNNKLYVYKFNE